MKKFPLSHITGVVALKQLRQSQGSMTTISLKMERHNVVTLRVAQRGCTALQKTTQTVKANFKVKKIATDRIAACISR